MCPSAVAEAATVAEAHGPVALERGDPGIGAAGTMVRKALSGMPDVPYLKLAAARTEQYRLTRFAPNRDVALEMQPEAEVGGFPEPAVEAAVARHDADLQAVNSRQAPERVKPGVLAEVTIAKCIVRTTLPPASRSVIRLATA